MTRYEKRSLLRFLLLYLGSVFLLLAIIGWLFYQNNAAMLKNSLKFEMLYETRKIESQLMQALKSRRHEDPMQILKGLGSHRFRVGFFDAAHRPIYSELTHTPGFSKSFTLGRQSCFSMVKGPFDMLGVHYIVLQETELGDALRTLRHKIVAYLALSFVFMTIVGYFLARLFLRPVREKIEALDRFIEDTTHELNTPISAILMTIQQLKGVDARRLTRLKASAQRLSTMYDSLAFGLEDKEDHRRIQRIDLAAFVRERLDTMEALALSSRIDLRSDLESCPIRINPENLRRLVDNLLSNAIKYSDPGGSVVLDLHGCRLAIRDRGIGIDASVLDEVRKRYRRANKERGGFGIGLDIVTRICREYGIGFALSSEKGRGTEVVLDFSSLRV